MRQETIINSFVQNAVFITVQATGFPTSMRLAVIGTDDRKRTHGVLTRI